MLGSGRINKPETLVSQSNNERNDIEIGLVRPGASGGQAIIEAPITQMNMNDIQLNNEQQEDPPGYKSPMNKSKQFADDN